MDYFNGTYSKEKLKPTNEKNEKIFCKFPGGFGVNQKKTYYHISNGIVESVFGL